MGLLRASFRGLPGLGCVMTDNPEARPLRFRNYPAESSERQLLPPVHVPEFEEVIVEADEVDVVAPEQQDILVSVAPKKANWDLRRDIANKLATLERKTQAAMIALFSNADQ